MTFIVNQVILGIMPKTERTLILGCSAGMELFGYQFLSIIDVFFILYNIYCNYCNEM